MEMESLSRDITRLEEAWVGDRHTCYRLTKADCEMDKEDTAHYFDIWYV